VAGDWDDAAARLRRTTEDLGTYVRTLASKLVDALPGQAQAQRGGLFGPPVASVTVTLGEVRYKLDVAHPTGNVERAQLVRGVAIRTSQISLEGFLDELTAHLRERATTDGGAVAALERLLL